MLVTILDPKKFCRNYVESGTKWPKCPKLSSRVKNGRTWENTISTVTVLMTLIFR